MARKRRAADNDSANGPLAGVKDYRHEAATRKNNPPAKIAAEGVVPLLPKTEYFYSPRRPPSLQFDPTGAPDQLPELLEIAKQRKLTGDEAKTLAEALRNGEPWLEWAGKREAKRFEVDPVVLQIHERISAKAILKVAARQDVERSLFADPEQAYHEAVQFYKHDIDWTNRLVLGDSLQVMSSLARREDLAGKVQMIYMDPPYGIKFASNFQPLIGNRDVKDKQQDLTREPEMVKAYRDTWNLGIHSYLTYLRDRLLVAKELLSDTGSIFVQMSDENLHHVRELVNGVFGEANAVCVITFAKTSGFGQTATLPSVSDYLLWYAKDKEVLKYRQLYSAKEMGSELAEEYKYLESPEGGTHALMILGEATNSETLRQGWRAFRPSALTSQGATGSGSFPFDFTGERFEIPSNQHWKTSEQGLNRLVSAGRVMRRNKSLSYIRYLNDFPVAPVNNNWLDTRWGFDASEKAYVVQTNTKVIQRCVLMTSDPGDLVLDPTCGSGTTAFVAEQWGRRWITIDTSRVSIAIARQRLLTCKFDYYKTRSVTPEDQARNPNGTWLTVLECGGLPPLSSGQLAGRTSPETPANGATKLAPDTASKLGEEKRQQAAALQNELPHSTRVTFKCKTVPHVTLKSIAQNTNLDPIFAKHEPILDAKLLTCNSALARVAAETRAKLSRKLMEKTKREGRKAITDADRRRWELPKQGEKWEYWQVPFDTDPDYPKDLAGAVTEYRKAWRAKMDEVNACIAANAEQEELVDQPEVIRDVLRVSGPFTVEAVQPPEMSLGDVHIVDLHASDLECGGLPPLSSGQLAGRQSPKTARDAASKLAEESGSKLPHSKPQPEGEGQFDGEPEELEGTFELRYVEARTDLETKNVEAYLEQMTRLLRMDGVRFPNNKHILFTRLEALKTSEPGLQAEGRWAPAGQLDPDPEGKATVCVAFGPQYGPVTAKMVEDVIRSANRLGYDDLVVAGFSFDGPAQQTIEEARRPRLRIHAANIRPDVNPAMNGLLKEQPGSQLFTVFGQPRTRVDGPDADGQYKVTMEGVDIYNPVENSITSTGADKVAAWFLDGDYDGRTFCITQAFFPDRTAWGKLSKALSDVIDPERFEALSGTISLPFPAGKHKCVAVKVIDPRGNEVMQVHKL